MFLFDFSHLQSTSEIEKRIHEVLDECDKHRRLNGDLQQENKELRIAFINSKEDVAEWKKSYESKQNEYNQLNQVYELKCNVLKQTKIQLTECKSVLEERKHHNALIESELLGPVCFPLFALILFLFDFYICSPRVKSRSGSMRFLTNAINIGG